MTLDFARSLPVEPGANLRGEQADTTWLYLLPQLDLGTGFIYVGGLAALRLLRDARELARLREVLGSGGAVFLAPGPPAPVIGALAVRLGVTHEVELAAGAGHGVGAASAGPALAGLRVPVTRVRTGLRHRAAVAVRLARSAAGRAVGSRRASGDARVSEEGEAIGVRAVRPARPRPRRGEGLLLHAGGGPGAVPRYLRDAAEAGGFPIREQGWRLAPPRGYRSQKVIFFVRGEDGTRAVLKLTQEPRFNRLLDNEADALGRLPSAEGAPRAPGLLFRTTHAGLSIVGEEALPGRAYVAVSEAGPEGAEAAAVARSLAALGAATARPATGLEAALGEVADAYARLFDPPRQVRDRLEAAVRTLSELGGEVPAVFMHGDATVFNVLIEEDDIQPGLVDWENAEPEGMPLWDLAHFLTSHLLWSAESAGRRADPATVAAALSGSGGLDPLRATAFEGYRAALGLPDTVTGPLLLTWAARHAVRDARQLREADLLSSFHHRLLHRLIAEERRAPDMPFR